jgi:hypothetical protein
VCVCVCVCVVTQQSQGNRVNESYYQKSKARATGQCNQSGYAGTERDGNTHSNTLAPMSTLSHTRLGMQAWSTWERNCDLKASIQAE